MQPIYLSQRTNILTLDIYPCRTHADIELLVTLHNAKEKCIATDLTLGPWSSYWSYSELAKQLNIYQEPSAVMPDIRQRKSAEEEKYNSIGRLIDRENKGRHLAIAAHQHAKDILHAIDAQGIKLLLVCAPKQGLHWGLDNAWLLYFLANGLRKSHCQLLIITDNYLLPEELPFAQYRLLNNTVKAPLSTSLKDDHTQVDYFPGVFIYNENDNAQYNNANTMVSLAPYCSITPPHSRVLSSNKKAVDNDNLLPYQKTFIAYQQLSDTLDKNPLNKCLSVLTASAHQAYLKGVYDLALRLYQRAYNFHPENNAKSMLELTLQTIRIAMMEFKDAAKQAAPNEEQAQTLTGPLHQTKGWGLLMSGQPEQAEKHFELARAQASLNEHDRSYWYLMNISALNQCRLGNIDRALKWEKDIEKKLSQLKTPDWQLHYVNTINQARLYKQIGDYEKSLHYYTTAFTINDGLRTQTDQVYFNFTLAQILCKMSHNSKAFIACFRAVIHWLSTPLPEALAPRMMNAILGINHYLPFYDMEAIAGALYQHLLGYAQYAGVIYPDENADKEESELVFSTIDAIDSHKSHYINTNSTIVGNDGWCVIASDISIAPVLSGPCYQQLRQLAIYLMKKLQPHYSFSQQGCLLLDSQYGNEIPSNASEATAMAVRHNLQHIYFAMEYRYLSHGDRTTIENNSIIALAPGIDQLQTQGNQLALNFRRFIDPVLISDNNTARLIKEAVTTKPLFELHEKSGLPFNELLESIRDLEKQKILTCTPT